MYTPLSDYCDDLRDPVSPIAARPSVNRSLLHHPLDDDWDETSFGQKPGPTWTRPVRFTEFLGEPQAKNLCNASLFADSIGCTLGTHVTIHWSMSHLFPHDDPRGQMALQGGIFDKATKMLKREGMDQVAFLWTIEDAPYKRRHTHWQLNVPHRLHGRLKEFIADTGCFRRTNWGGEGEAIRVTGHKDMTPERRIGTLLYALKALRPTEPLPGIDGEGIFEPLGIDTEQSLPILGKRCGTSQNIGPAARGKANWTELAEWKSIDGVITPLRIGW